MMMNKFIYKLSHLNRVAFVLKSVKRQQDEMKIVAKKLRR
jgi:hypothetical protein